MFKKILKIRKVFKNVKKKKCHSSHSSKSVRRYSPNHYKHLKAMYAQKESNVNFVLPYGHGIYAPGVLFPSPWQLGRPLHSSKITIRIPAVRKRISGSPPKMLPHTECMKFGITPSTV